MDQINSQGAGQGPIENQKTVGQSLDSAPSADHAFPALEAGRAELPPFFRFMWASR